MGKSGTDTEGYAKEVVLADFEKPGDDDVIQKLVKDFAAAGKPIEEAAIRKKAERLMAEANTQLNGGVGEDAIAGASLFKRRAN